MRISRKELSSIAASGSPFSKQRASRANINKVADGIRIRLRLDIEQHIQPWMTLLDEAVRFFMYFERYQYTRKLAHDTSPFALQLSRLRSDVLCIRELISIGQEGAAHVIARGFVDGIELAMSLADDPKFSVAYSEADDQSEFWKKNIGFGKIYVRVERFIRRTGGSVEQIDSLIAKHKAIKKSFSGHVHIASYSAFRSAAVPSITHPGMLHIGGLGYLSIHMPRLCMLIAEETHTFAACCINAFVKPNPPKVFSGYRPTKKLHDAITSAHVLQELLMKYGDQLDALGESFFDFEGDGESAI
jgi:hypothetical protein